MQGGPQPDAALNGPVVCSACRGAEKEGRLGVQSLFCFPAWGPQWIRGLNQLRQDREKRGPGSNPCATGLLGLTLKLMHLHV